MLCQLTFHNSSIMKSLKYYYFCNQKYLYVNMLIIQHVLLFTLFLCCVLHRSHHVKTKLQLPTSIKGKDTKCQGKNLV